MKKLVAISIMAAMLLTVAAVAMASETDWIILMRASTTAYTGYGQNLQLGCAPGSIDGKGAEDVKGTFGATTAGVASYQPTFSDLPPLYTTDKVSAITGDNKYTWDLRLWANTSYGGNNLRLAVWTVSTKALPTTFAGKPYVYTLEVYDDPTGLNTGFKKTWDAGIANGAATTPAFYLDWANPGTKMDAASAIDGGIKLRLTVQPVPEPSSMLALASGLAGMVGFGIRRRRA
jgi:hypothetical protein